MRFTLFTEVLGGTGHHAKSSDLDRRLHHRHGVHRSGRSGTRRLTMAVALSGAMLMSPQACAPSTVRTASVTPTVTITAAGATSMTIAWPAVGGARSYDLVYAGAGLSGPITVRRLTSRTRTISGLTPGGAYEAQVRAVTKRGPRSWSATARIVLAGGASTPADESPVVTTVSTPTLGEGPIAPAPAPAPTAAPAAPTAAPAAGGGAVTGPLPAPSAGSSASGTQPFSGPIQASGDGTGNFRVTCFFSHMNADDSIVAPGRTGAAHLHTYFGNTASDATSTPASLLSGGNSTCSGGISNRSSYWVPTVLDAGGRPVTPSMNQVYYKSGYQGTHFSRISATLPNGLKLIAGNARATGPQPQDAGQDTVRWTCGVDTNNGPTMIVDSTPTIPGCAAGTDLWAVIRFPQCWDGANLDSADHKSHMAYGTFGIGCPASHPVALPEITYNVHWPVTTGTSAGWRLSSDMYAGSGGYSLHGDIITAWDTSVSSTWLQNCVRRDADCHIGIVSDTRQLIYATR